jgi:glutamate racemase
LKIGVFDSGLGGLTAVRELFRIVPGADIVYLGDTGRVPYGSKSKETITRYAVQALEWLSSTGVGAIVVACGTVSSVALEGLRCSVPLFGVVEAASRKAAEYSVNGRIGVIATAATVRSGAYERAIASVRGGAEVIVRACPLFVPLVENGRVSPRDAVVRTIAEDHLREIRGFGADTLLLGCTHYPLLSEVISEVMGGGVTLVDSGKEAASMCVRELGADKLDSGGVGHLACFATDSAEDFKKQAEIFLGGLPINSVKKLNWIDVL